MPSGRSEESYTETLTLGRLCQAQGAILQAHHVRAPADICRTYAVLTIHGSGPALRLARASYWFSSF